MPYLTFKVIAHQWFWSYEYEALSADYAPGRFDSYMVPLHELYIGHHRLLDVDA